jgi:hypothetical protein
MNLFVTILLLLLALPAWAQTTLNVTNFGARGDAVRMLVNTVSNSTVITVRSTNQLSSADVGKLILLFGAGPYTTPTNNQDLIATITNVVNATNIYISSVAGATSNSIAATYGTQNATAFQNCVNAAAGTNIIINIPAGTYLLISTQAINPGFTMANEDETHPAVSISSGGITLSGAGMDSTVLLGCGAWQNKGSHAYRGAMFFLQGPVTNNYPLVFDDLTLDGGVLQGLTAYNWFPARTTDGDGWDVTHDAVIDIGAPLHSLKIFRNCRITHWRGEALKSVSSWTNGFIQMTNCLFDDNNASAINFSFSHDINGCTFSNMYFAMEFYAGYASADCFFRNCTLTGLTGVTTIALNGALTNHIQPNYNITSNKFFLSGGFGILTSPAQNLNVIGNQFINGGTGIGIGSAGYQGTAINSNIIVELNSFSNTYFAIEIMGSGPNSTANMLVSSNYATGGNSFAYGYGWSTNVSFRGNVVSGYSGGLNSTQLSGQWYLDDTSNQFPPRQDSATSGITNIISYIYGMRHIIHVNVTNAIYVIDDTHPQQIPPGAVLTITNSGNYSAPLYSSASMSGTPITMTTNQTVTYHWTNGVWVNASSPLATSPIILTGAAKLPNGAFQFAFTNTPAVTNYITTNITTTIITNWSTRGPPRITGYTTNITTTLTTNTSENTVTVLTTTNLLLPLTNWTVLGTVTDSPPGHFQFSDPQATNRPMRFYRVRSP